MAPDFVPSSRRVTGSILEYSAGYSTPKTGQKTSQSIKPDCLIYFYRGPKPIGQLLDGVKLIALHETVIEQVMTDSFVVKHRDQYVVTIESELKPKRRVCRHEQTVLSEFWQDEVKVIVKAL